MLDSLLRMLALTRKELLAILKDPRARFSLLAPPVIQCLIFGYAATYDLNDVPYAVFDQDHSAASRDLIARLSGSGVFHCVGYLDRASDIDRMINRRRALLVLQIDQDFERRLLSGREAQVQVVADGRNSNTAGTALGYVSGIVATFNEAWLAEHNQPSPIMHVSLRMVQPEFGDTLAHGAQPHRHADATANALAHGNVRGTRARAGNIRSIAGHSLSTG